MTKTMVDQSERDRRRLARLAFGYPTPCRCGNKRPSVETDRMTGSSAIECMQCGRAIAAPDKAEARRMWDAAMACDPPH